MTAKKFNISETIWNGTFAYRMYNESKDKAYVFVGAFFKDGSEADKLIENIQEVCFDGVDNCHYVVTGIGFDYTNKLADFFLVKLILMLTNCIAIYLQKIDLLSMVQMRLLNLIQCLMLRKLTRKRIVMKYQQ